MVGSSGGVSPLIVVASYRTTFNSVDPRSMSPAKDGEISSGQFWLAYKIYSSGPADVTVDMEQDGAPFGTNTLASCYLACS